MVAFSGDGACASTPGLKTVAGRSDGRRCHDFPCDVPGSKVRQTHLQAENGGVIGNRGKQYRIGSTGCHRG